MNESKLKKRFILTMYTLGIIIILVFYAYHSATLSYVQKGAEENLEYVSDQISSSLNEYFNVIDASSKSISYNSLVVDFLSEGNFAQRYSEITNIYSLVSEIVSTNKYLDGIILYDSYGTSYQYGVEFSNTHRKTLLSTTFNNRASTFFTFRFKDRNYICIQEPILTIESGKSVNLGTVLLFSSESHIMDLLSTYKEFPDLSILLWEKKNDMCVLSTRPENSNIDSIEQITDDLSYNLISEIGNYGFYLITSIDKSLIIPYSSIFIRAVALVIILIIVLITITTVITQQSILIPIDKLIKSMSNMGNTSLKERIPLSKSPDINILINGLNDLLTRLEEYSRRAFLTQQHLYEVELQKKQHELYRLRKQINTHFLFNTLNAIKSLAIEANRKDISQISEGLVDLVRYAYSKEDYINVFAEMQIINKYIYIMNIRFNNSFTVIFNIDDRLCEYKILRQLIQPLAENAFIHGRENTIDKLTLTITGQIQSGHLFISVKDNGVGISKAKLDIIKQNIDSPDENYAQEGISLININRRIKLYYGDEYSLKISSEYGVGTELSFSIPLIQENYE